MSNKTSTAAVVLIPPEAVWPPIQAIRRRHDRQVRRWMPHVTLLYPFRPRAEFKALLPPLSEAAAAFPPFEVTLSEFGFFAHDPDRFTIWLAPEPKERLVALQEALWRVTPDCDDTRRFEHGFTPHLSVGQVEGEAAMERLAGSLQAAWEPLSFEAGAVSFISRGEPPDDVFRVVYQTKLGR